MMMMIAWYHYLYYYWNFLYLILRKFGKRREENMSMKKSNCWLLGFDLSNSRSNASATSIGSNIKSEPLSNTAVKGNFSLFPCKKTGMIGSFTVISSENLMCLHLKIRFIRITSNWQFFLFLITKFLKSVRFFWLFRLLLLGLTHVKLLYCCR